MDHVMEQRWRNRLPPFDGVTVHPQEFLPLRGLRRVLSAVFSCLHACRPDSQLYTLYDWHEHDGILLEAKATSWKAIRSLLASDETLLAASAGDTYVRIGFFPEERDFYWRIYIPAEYDHPDYSADNPHPSPCGDFDVTCAEPLARQVRQAVERAGSVMLEMEPAAAFFDRNYSG